MAFLRRTLYLQALVWAVVGVALVALPKLLLENLFDQLPLDDYAWVRIVGLQAFGLAMLMVLVAHRIDEVWWWSWAFAIPTGLSAVTALLNAAFGLRDGSSAVLWWLFGAVALAFTAQLLYGLLRAGQERPIV